MNQAFAILPLGQATGPGSAPPGFWRDLLTAPSTIAFLALALACLAAATLAVLALGRLHRARRRPNPMAEADGTATIEFALVTPIILFFALALAQTTMLLAGHIVVHYSAFAAVRSAIVQIPTDYADDSANVYTASSDRTKHNAIRRAAIFAAVPISGERRTTSSNIGVEQFVQSMRDFYQMNNAEEPRWLDTLLADRLRYAAENTAVLVMRPQVDGEARDVDFEPIEIGQQYQFQARDPVTVRVLHRFNLGVPYVNRVFADAAHDDMPGRYIELQADYTLTLEGRRDELPPQPTVPRLP